MRIMALDYAGGHPCDTAFLDVEMAGMSGMALAERLRRMKPDVNIIFVTGHGSYRDGAFGLHASGYLMKPVTARKVREELKDLRYPVAPARRVRIRTFGNFEVYLDGKPLMFRYSRTRELLAYLVDRQGALCAVGEVAGVLFEDGEPHDVHLRRLCRDLTATLEAAGHRAGEGGLQLFRLERRTADGLPLPAGVHGPVQLGGVHQRHAGKDAVEAPSSNKGKYACRCV